MRNRRRAGNEQDVGRAMQKPRQRDLHGRRFQGCRRRVEHGGLQWVESTQGEKWHIRNALLPQFLDESVILALPDVVEILDAHDLRDFARLGKLPWRDVAQTQVTDEPLL